MNERKPTQTGRFKELQKMRRVIGVDNDKNPIVAEEFHLFLDQPGDYGLANDGTWFAKPPQGDSTKLNEKDVTVSAGNKITVKKIFETPIGKLELIDGD